MKCPAYKDATLAFTERQGGNRPSGDSSEHRYRDDEQRDKPRKSFLRDLFN